MQHLTMKIRLMSTALLVAFGVGGISPVFAEDADSLQKQDQLRQQDQDRLHVQDNLGAGPNGSPLLTQEERSQFQARMKAAQTQAERNQIQAEHREMIQQRAREKGVEPPGKSGPKKLQKKDQQWQQRKPSQSGQGMGPGGNGGGKR